MSKEPFDLFPLGKDKRCHVSTNCAETQVNNNILVVGGSGSGKTMSVLDPMLLHLQHGNAVSVFTKHSQRTDDLKQILEGRGYKVYTLDFTKPETCRFGYDPLHYCSTDNQITELATSIVCSKSDKNVEVQKDPYWDNSAANLLAVLLRFVSNGHYAGGRTLADALELVDCLSRTNWQLPEAQESEQDYLYFQDGDEPDEEPEDEKSDDFMLDQLSHLAEVDPNGAALWKTLLNGEAAGMKASIQGSLLTPLKLMFTPSVCTLMKKKPFDFGWLLKPKTVLFVYTSPVEKALHMFISIFYSQLFRYLFQAADARPDQVLPHPVYVLCDDFATGCTVPEFPQLISIFREKGISTTLLVQSESQLTGLYNEVNATTIINNCDTYIYLGGNDLSSVDNVSKRLNIPYTEVLYMPIGREYFFRRGQRPITTERYDFCHDPLYENRNQKQSRTGREKSKAQRA